MLLIYGVALLALAAILTAAAGLAYQAENLTSSLRRFVGGQIFGVILASIMGLGLVTLFVFITQLKTQPDIPLQAILAVVLAVAGYAGVWFLNRRAGVSSVTDPAATAGSQRRAA